MKNIKVRVTDNGEHLFDAILSDTESMYKFCREIEKRGWKPTPLMSHHEMKYELRRLFMDIIDMDGVKNPCILRVAEDVQMCKHIYLEDFLITISVLAQLYIVETDYGMNVDEHWERWSNRFKRQVINNELFI